MTYDVMTYDVMTCDVTKILYKRRTVGEVALWIQSAALSGYLRSSFPFFLTKQDGKC